MKTDEQIIAEKEQHFQDMDAEQKAKAYRNEYQEDCRICADLSQKLKATIEPIKGDIHHIRVNGQVYGYNAFEAWKKQRLIDLKNGKVGNQKLGFFTH